MEGMAEQFRTTAPNTAESTLGFVVQWIPHGGIIYRDASGEVRIDSELLVKPSGILVHEKSRTLRGLDSARREKPLSNVKRALEYMGHRVEFWNDGMPDRR